MPKGGFYATRPESSTRAVSISWRWPGATFSARVALHRGQTVRAPMRCLKFAHPQGDTTWRQKPHVDIYTEQLWNIWTVKISRWFWLGSSCSLFATTVAKRLPSQDGRAHESKSTGSLAFQMGHPVQEKDVKIWIRHFIGTFVCPPTNR